MCNRQNSPKLRRVERWAFPKEIRCLALERFFAKRKHESECAIGRSPKMHRARGNKNQGGRLYSDPPEIDVQQARTVCHVEDLIEIVTVRAAAVSRSAEEFFPRSNMNGFRRAKPVVGERIKWWRVG